MNEHAAEVVREIQTRIASLQDLEAGLKEFFAADAPAPALESNTAETRRTQRKKPAKKLSRTESGAAVIAQGAKLPQPFGRKELAYATHLTMNGAGSAITRWMDKGWVKKIGYGQFERTAKYPAQGPIPAPAAAAPAPASTEPRAVLEKKLQDAIKQRDHARDNGRKQMEEIFQHEIDRLEQQLEQ